MSFWHWNRTVEGLKPGTRPKGGESKRSADKSAVSGAKEGGANVAERICRSPPREFQIDNLVSKRGFLGCNQLKSNHGMPRNDFFWTAVMANMDLQTPMLKIGSLQLDNWLIMAPMAGITNLPFRMMVKRMGAALVTTEMISAKGLVLQKKRTLHYLQSCPEEKPLSVQLFGSDPAVMRDAVQIAVSRGADIIDINAGCPVKKVTKTGAGAALLREPERLRQILTAARAVCRIPLTVKVRAGWRPESADVVSIALLSEDCGVDAVTVHPRFASQGYSGHADWSIIGKLKDSLQIPVIGNGDILRPSDAFNMRKETGCDGVMIGRGAIGNPWIFKQMLLMESGHDAAPPTAEERKGLIMEHFTALSAMVGESRAARIMRSLLLWYTKGLPHSATFRGHITCIKDMDSLLSVMHAYFSSLEKTQS